MRRVLLLCLAAACGGGTPPPARPGPAAAPSAAPARAAPIVLNSAVVNGTTLAYRVVGDSGTPVVFVHGSLGDQGDWNGQVATFAQTHRVLVYSRRYHPPNPQVDDAQTYSPNLHAEDLAALLLQLDLAPAHVVGESYGAYTALVLAMEHPELVRSIVLGEPPIMPLLTRSPEGDALRRNYVTTTLDVARAAFSRGDSVGALTAFLRGEGLAPGSTTMSHAFEMRREMAASRDQYMPPLTCADLGALHTGVLLVRGDRSPPVFQAITTELARCLQNDSTATVPSAGHWMNRSNPSYYNQLVLRYIANH
ncbi:MAG TPA: alpha/beta hydrolase [Gemmatimonadales bacterium]|nr:alpha/beta hydrolase [Gemmatimonadales bacterium]